jgi:Predicted metal-binding protein (DUF2103)
MSKDSRSGGKFSGHTTLIPAAALVADIADKSGAVYRICPGYIKAGLPSVSGNKRVKITQEANYLLLAVRDNTSQQEVHVYAKDSGQAMLDIARGSRSAGLRIAFK